MIKPGDKREGVAILQPYQELVLAMHPSRAGSWPLLNGWNRIVASFKTWRIIAFKDHFGTMETSNGVGELEESAVGVDAISEENCETVRARLQAYFNLGNRDAIVFVRPGGIFRHDELNVMFRQHEQAMGLAPMKIFLSHKGADKPTVRQFKNILDLFGFTTWIDEDDLPAGSKLERGIRGGFTESCAAVFFITPKFTDEAFLASEIDYAIEEKRAKGDQFAIITLVFSQNGLKGDVPSLLRSYVWKEPVTQLDALREIVRALPIVCGAVTWRT